MGEVSIIGLDLAKNVFQAHGAGADGAVVFRRKLSRAQLLKFIAAQSPCIVAMEACATRRLSGGINRLAVTHKSLAAALRCGLLRRGLRDARSPAI